MGTTMLKTSRDVEMLRNPLKWYGAESAMTRHVTSIIDDVCMYVCTCMIQACDELGKYVVVFAMTATMMEMKLV